VRLFLPNGDQLEFASGPVRVMKLDEDGQPTGEPIETVGSVIRTIPKDTSPPVPILQETEFTIEFTDVDPAVVRLIMGTDKLWVPGS